MKREKIEVNSCTELTSTNAEVEQQCRSKVDVFQAQIVCYVVACACVRVACSDGSEGGVGRKAKRLVENLNAYSSAGGEVV